MLCKISSFVLFFYNNLKEDFFFISLFVIIFVAPKCNLLKKVKLSFLVILITSYLWQDEEIFFVMTFINQFYFLYYNSLRYIFNIYIGYLNEIHFIFPEI